MEMPLVCGVFTVHKCHHRSKLSYKFFVLRQHSSFCADLIHSFKFLLLKMAATVSSSPSLLPVTPTKRCHESSIKELLGQPPSKRKPEEELSPLKKESLQPLSITSIKDKTNPLQNCSQEVINSQLARMRQCSTMSKEELVEILVPASKI